MQQQSGSRHSAILLSQWSNKALNKLDLSNHTLLAYITISSSFESLLPASIHCLGTGHVCVMSKGKRLVVLLTAESFSHWRCDDNNSLGVDLFIRRPLVYPISVFMPL